MSWAITQVDDRHWAWAVWTATGRRYGVAATGNAAERAAKLQDLRHNRTSSVEHPPPADSTEQRTPGTPDSHNRKDCST